MKKIIIGLMVSVGLFAQASPNSVAQLIALNDVSTTQQVIGIKAANNIGQNSHQVYVYSSDITASSCSSNGSWSGNVALQGSTDGSTWLQVGTNISNFLSGDGSQFVQTNSRPLVAFASGIYPYLRVVYKNTNATNCQTTIWYTGSISPQAYTANLRAVNDNFIYTPFKVALMGDNDVLTSSNECNGVTTASNSFAGGILTVYGLYLYNPAAANTVILKFGGGTNTSGLAPWLTLTSFQQYAQFNGMPLSKIPYYVAYGISKLVNATGQTVILNLANATEIDGYVVYRCE